MLAISLTIHLVSKASVAFFPDTYVGSGDLSGAS